MYFVFSVCLDVAFKYFDKDDIAITSVIALDDQKGKVKPLPVFKSVSFTGTGLPNHFFFNISKLIIIYINIVLNQCSL